MTNSTNDNSNTKDVSHVSRAETDAASPSMQPPSTMSTEVASSDEQDLDTEMLNDQTTKTMDYTFPAHPGESSPIPSLLQLNKRRNESVADQFTNKKAHTDHETGTKATDKFELVTQGESSTVQIHASKEVIMRIWYRIMDHERNYINNLLSYKVQSPETETVEDLIANLLREHKKDASLLKEGAAAFAPEPSKWNKQMRDTLEEYPDYDDYKTLALEKELPNGRPLHKIKEIGRSGGYFIIIKLPSSTSALDYNLNVIIAKGKLRKKLIESAGADFEFSDRTLSCETLLNCIQKRHGSWKNDVSDRNLHPLPYLADGPGTGKTRELEELSGAFKDFVAQSTANDAFKQDFEKAVFINITFGNGTPYGASIGIEKAICLRILKQFDPDNPFDFVKNLTTLGFGELLSKIVRLIAESKRSKCVVLGIDEVNKVYEENKEEFKALFDLIGGLSCSCPVFFVPIVAGTVLGPIGSVVSKSTHPPCKIPLPLLSYESCENILRAKLPDLVVCPRMKQLISDVGGHCRSLEFLYDDAC